MACHIPFVNSERDAALLRQHYKNSEFARVSLENVARVGVLPAGMGLWIDGAVDGFEEWPNIQRIVEKSERQVPSWKKYIEKFDGAAKLGEESFQQSPDAAVVQKFVDALLDACVKSGPVWLSVPQLPYVANSSRNKINRALAEATATWRANRRFHGKLILPIILTHQQQVNLKTDRTKKIALAKQCYARAAADGYWVVESSLLDQSGSGTFGKRFGGLIQFHEEIKGELKRAIRIGGPYWGINLVLWVRDLIDYPAIGVGGGYQYHLPGGTAKKAKSRVALAPLRRWAIWGPKLKDWLSKVPKDDDAYRELRDLEKDFNRFSDDEAARAQLARFYKRWFEKIEGVNPKGRALALFQDLSSAYVLGTSLQDLPEEEGTARKPGRVAEQLMLWCLPRPSSD